jgi:hypothetical protein
MHENIKKPYSDHLSQTKTLQTKIFKTSRTKNPLLIDISACRHKYIDLQSMMLLKNQHPNVHVCVPLNDGSRRYLEVYISKNQDKQELLENGLYFKDSNLTVYPCEALTDSANIINVKLSNLPLLPKEDVFAGLKHKFSHFR